MFDHAQASYCIVFEVTEVVLYEVGVFLFCLDPTWAIRFTVDPLANLNVTVSPFLDSKSGFIT